MHQLVLRRAAGAGALLLLAGCGFLPVNRTSYAGTEIIEAAPKPPPVDSAFDSCGAAGSQPDYVINRLKNRVDEGQYLPVPWSMIARLPWPRLVALRFRNQWTEGERQSVDRFEGRAVRVEGFVIAYKLEFPEPPNCYAKDERERDFHIWLADAPGRSKRRSVIVEITPRVRVSHPNWTEERLAALVETAVRVRVSGWLMLDQMHPESIGQARATLWEVHPIMRLEWQSRNGQWISLDQATPANDSTPR